MITLTQMAQTTIQTYRVLLAHGYTRGNARTICREIYTLHGFGTNGYLRKG